VDVSFDWKPVEHAEERGDMGRLNARQAAAFWINSRGLMAPSQQRIAVVRM
jgi:hypothetical protein